MSPQSLHTAQGHLLAIDDGKGSLGDAPLRLVRAGVDVVHSSEIDEAELLARQEGMRISGLVLPSSGGVAHVEMSLEVVGPHAEIGPDRVALLGRRPDEATLDRLRELGVMFRLWDPYEDRDLRFIGWSLIWGGSLQNLRLDLRVPTALPAHAIRRGEERQVLVTDLSHGGAFLQTEHSFPGGCRIGVVIELPNEQLELPALVRWTRPRKEASPQLRPGCGVEFLNPPPRLRAVLKQHLEEETDRFRL